MEINDVLNRGKPTITLERPEISLNREGNSELTNIGIAKLNALKNSIQDIKKLINEREQLSGKFIQEGEDVKTEINNFLLENENTTEFEKADLMKEKNQLRSKKIEISEIQMKEKVDSWKDIALLKKELRQQEQELSEKQERINSITKLLDESQ
jgi:nitrate/TMAO reductase-like tetraheme cytochrome c subunit